MATQQRISAGNGMPAMPPTEQHAQTEQTKRRRGPQPGTESARRGGMAVREKYGRDYYAQIGAKGGKANREQHGAEYYSTIGRRGGSTTRQRLGAEHYERIGRMGGLRAKQRDARATERASEAKEQ